MPEIKLESIDLLNEAPLKLQIQSLNASSIHWHNEYEVLFVLQGSLSVTCKQNHFSLKPGDLLMKFTPQNTSKMITSVLFCNSVRLSSQKFIILPLIFF